VACAQKDFLLAARVTTSSIEKDGSDTVVRTDTLTALRSQFPNAPAHGNRTVAASSYVIATAEIGDRIYVLRRLGTQVLDPANYRANINGKWAYLAIAGKSKLV
jgi:hypothetical protein